MGNDEQTPFDLHEDTALFREAVTFTAAETTFPSRLIEKDYYCTILLDYLARTDRSLVFRGARVLRKFISNSIASARIWIS